MAAGSLSPSRFSFLEKGLLLPLRNPGLSVPIFTLAVVVQTSLPVYLAMLPWEGALLGALGLLAVAPVVEAVSTSASIAMCVAGSDDGDPQPTFPEVLTKVLDASLAAGPIATALHAVAVDVACQLGAGVVLGIVVNLAFGYTGSLLVLDLLVPVVLAAGVARLYLGVVLAVAVAVSAAEPGLHGAAALRRAWVLTAGNAEQAVILILAKGALAFAAAVSPRHTSASREPPELGYLIVSGAVQVYGVCAVAAYYYECKGRAQGSPAQLLLIIGTGREWLSSLPPRCCNMLREVLHGRCSMRRTLATLLAHLRCWSVWTLLFVSSHPWVSCVLVVCAGRLILEGPPHMSYPSSLESYRNIFRVKYHVYPKGCANKGVNRARFWQHHYLT